jgi:hypothetical protein
VITKREREQAAAAIYLSDTPKTSRNRFTVKRERDGGRDCSSNKREKRKTTTKKTRFNAKAIKHPAASCGGATESMKTLRAFFYAVHAVPLRGEGEGKETQSTATTKKGVAIKSPPFLLCPASRAS